MNSETNYRNKLFSQYQIFIVFILAFLQFTVILDFMVLSPLGAILLQEMGITTSQFGFVVSAYAFSAGLSGLLFAGFADRFDRKKFLLFFYAGFIFGTFLCTLAGNYHFLLFARIVTGFFGGIINSIIYSIITDLFKMEVRGRVMGFVQMAFSSSQVMGIPVGLYLANHYGWHSTFGLIVLIAIIVGISIRIFMKPVRDHLKANYDHNAFVHLRRTLVRPEYLQAFAATTLMATGGFMLMPFASAFSVNNMGVSLDELPLVYMITGFGAMISGPIIGKLSDTFGKYKIFSIGSFFSMIIVIIISSRGITPLILVVFLNVLLFAGISSRMISGMALMTAVPDAKDRGAFMGINSSIQQLSGGVGSAVAGIVVVQTVSGKIEHYNTLGYVVSATMFVTVAMMYFIDKFVSNKMMSGKTT